MFNYNHIQAIFIAMFIKIVEGNMKKANELLGKVRYNQPVWDMPGLVVYLSQNEDTKQYSLIIEAMGTKQHFKLSKTPTINKRVLNEMKVWFHKYGRPYREDARRYINKQVDDLDIRSLILKTPFIHRLLGTQQEFTLKYTSNLLNEIMPTRVVIQRNIFNKLNVFVEVTTSGAKGPLSELFPVHFGVSRQYTAHVSKDPVNHWLRQVVFEHLNHNLRITAAI